MIAGGSSVGGGVLNICTGGKVAGIRSLKTWREKEKEGRET